jgi:hypothetical protein
MSFRCCQLPLYVLNGPFFLKVDQQVTYFRLIIITKPHLNISRDSFFFLLQRVSYIFMVLRIPFQMIFFIAKVTDG